MQKQIFYVGTSDCKLYCEKRGNGPLFVIMPDGVNDCELYARFADLMAEEFTVVSYDPRGGSRSMPTVNRKVTPEILADDMAAVIRYMDMGKASAFGCSSGGQGVLMTGVKYPDLIKNVIVHEAALQMDVQLPGVGYDFIQTYMKTYGPYMKGKNVNPFMASLYVSVYPENEFDKETNDRMEQNSAYWNEYYLGTVDTHSYTKEELSRIPACDFSVGAWTTAWHPYANIATAERGGFSYTWMPSAHYPVLSCTELYAEFCKKTIHKYD